MQMSSRLTSPLQQQVKAAKQMWTHQQCHPADLRCQTCRAQTSLISWDASHGALTGQQSIPSIERMGSAASMAVTWWATYVQPVTREHKEADLWQEDRQREICRVLPGSKTGCTTACSQLQRGLDAQTHGWQGRDAEASSRPIQESWVGRNNITRKAKATCQGCPCQLLSSAWLP